MIMAVTKAVEENGAGSVKIGGEKQELCQFLETARPLNELWRGSCPIKFKAEGKGC